VISRADRGEPTAGAVARERLRHWFEGQTKGRLLRCMNPLVGPWPTPSAWCRTRPVAGVLRPWSPRKEPVRATALAAAGSP